MTLGSPFPPSTTTSAQQARFSRRVSSLNMSVDDEPEDKTDLLERPGLRRQVSNEAMSSVGSDCDDDKKPSSGRGSPIRCVSEFDKVAQSQIKRETSSIPNPLNGAAMFDQHKRALRLEAELQPMRLILSRLMAHPTLNRKGLFNKPVDPVALALPDYFAIITKPMDFCTVKARLHALAYQSRRQVFDDIRLVLHNAMQYNPPQNIVHTLARDLLAFFDDQLQAFAPELAGCAPPLKDAPLPRTVSSISEQQQTPVHTQATRLSAASNMLASCGDTGRKRKKRGSRSTLGHDCLSCQGRSCSICHQGCLHLEPTLLICNGFNCAGAKIRKGAAYYIAPDGSRQYCQKCYIGLPAVLPSTKHGTECRYKVSLLKRKNDEEVVEEWLTCVKCQTGVHAMCAMYNKFVGHPDFECPDCLRSVDTEPATIQDNTTQEAYTYLSGADIPVPASEVPNLQSHDMSADTLPETEESIFLQRKVRERMKSQVENAEKTVSVRIISDCHRSFSVPDVVRKHFRMQTSAANGPLAPPLKVHYRSKAIALFQKVDGLDVCVFCMYVQEYDGDDEYEQPGDDKLVEKKKRVYIAYLDSVEHFRPRSCRTNVFQEILVSYLTSARKRGYESAHIWACPPSRGNSFVFWNHPASQRTPTTDRLLSWYHGALSRAIDCGVVADVKSLYESDFQEHLEPLSDDADATMPGKMECPPLLDGDFWIEEAVRIHDLHLNRQLKSKFDQGNNTADNPQRCPALEVAALVRDRVIAHPSALAFRRPVNAAAMKLKDYHKIITKPMDLGTVHSRLILGEYDVLRDVVDDVQLVFANAKRYNPKGHIVHEKAIEMSEMFFTELDGLAESWTNVPTSEPKPTWTAFAQTSMNLDATFSSSGPATTLTGVPQINNNPPSGTDSTAKSCDLVGGGVEAVQKSMVGNDTWMLDKRNPTPPKAAPSSGKKNSRRKRGAKDVIDESPCKRRRQSWLAEEVGASVRRSRTSFFSCCLKPSNEKSVTEDLKVASFDAYAASYEPSQDTSIGSLSSIADVRHALLEFSQFRNLEFDTLRRAKYSSAILLYHLHCTGAPGMKPVCSMCNQDIQQVRWHRISRVTERRRVVKRPSLAGRQARPKAPYHPEELCVECHPQHALQDEFIPIQVSFN